MNIKKSIFVFLLFCIFIYSKSENAIRNIQVLENGWRFINKDIKHAESVLYNDSSWQSVRVPHDWAISGNFDMNLDVQNVQVIEDGENTAKLRTGHTGALPAFGVGWYRIVLPVENTDKDKRISIEFDGAMSLAKVYLNGTFIGECPYGYSSFSLELTKYIQFGKKNLLAVRLENKIASSRWYTGAGIYRNVRLVKTNTIHVVHWGTYITTPKVNEKIAEVNINTIINADSATKYDVELVTEIYSADGKMINSVSTTQKVETTLSFPQNLKIINPQLWSIETPTIYTAISKVFVGKKLKDVYKTTFGCRSIRFDKDKGFFLNEKPVKIKGVCLHHDLGPLGAAVNYRATERQLQIMKEMGCNAIRTSHNPPSPELLQLCDSMGFLVMDEAFDQWKYEKNKNDYHNYFEEWHEKDLKAMIHRDRNHPSIVIWSIGNEVREQKMSEGKEIARSLVAICHKEDQTRPATAALNYHNEAIENGLAGELDLVGFNYKPQSYNEKHAEHPNFVLFGSETASTVSSRGEYKFPVKEIVNPWYNDYQLSSYDLERQGWATSPDAEFEMQDDCEFVFGEFVWTGFDYLGEPTPYNEGTPARSSYFGIVDLAGLKKDRFYLYQSKWSSTPVLHIFPHWNWPERIGQQVPVFCYTNYPKAELFVNGKSMGIKQKDHSNKFSHYRLMWNDVVYQPGEIKVVAYNDKDIQVAEQVIKTAGEPFTVKLTADREKIKVGGKDLSFVSVEVVDKDGNLCPRADNMLFFKVQGEGNLKAVCNGNPIDQTSFGSTYMRAFNGKIVAILESGSKSGELNLKVFGGKLKAG